MKKVKESLEKEESELKEVMKEWQNLMLRVPNIPDMSVPEGNTDADNKEVKVWGEKTDIRFRAKGPCRAHDRNSMVDFERGSKVHGFRGYFLTGDGARLSFAIWQYAMEFFSKKNFTPVIPPVIVRKMIMYGTGYLPAGEEDLYKTQDSDYLVGTAEVPLMGMHADEVFDEKDLPKRYLGFSPCFRREAGAHSKDIKGLIRVHEFFKFEQLILCPADHETRSLSMKR